MEHSMPQGRELDAYLAKHAAGWHVGGIGLVEAGLIPPEAWVDEYGEFRVWIRDWHPTTDPAAALGLLEEMRKRGWTYTISACTDKLAEEFRYPVFDVSLCWTGTNEEKGDHNATADTLPAAICACVYQALGGDNA